MAFEHLARRIVNDEISDAAKLLFDIKFETIKALLEGSPSASDQAGLQRYLVQFRGSAILLEDGYHGRFVGLVETLRNAVDVQVGAEFADLVLEIEDARRRLIQGGPPSKEAFQALPKVVRKKLSTNMAYLRYFAISTDDEIACLALEMMRDSKVAASIMKSNLINSALLAKIAERGQLMNSYDAKLRLAFNPKAQPTQVRPFLKLLRRDDLEALCKSNSVSREVRDMACQELARRPKVPGRSQM